MTTTYAKHVSRKNTSQTEPIPGKNQVKNSAGGYSFAVDDFSRLNRFLVLGASGGSFYANEQKLTRENAKAVQHCLDLDYKRTVDFISSVSTEGKAPKNSPAIFALALAASHSRLEVRDYALENLQKVCRIGTHLFEFVENLKELRKWSRNLRGHISRWYTDKPPDKLAYQLTKYQQRNGWSNRDLIRLSHAKATGVKNDLLYWAVKGWDSVGDEPHQEKDLQLVWAFERAKRTTCEREIIRLIHQYGLVREHVPTELLTKPSVWEALLQNMPMTAMIRNLATMTKVGLISPLSAASRTVSERLVDVELLKKARVHPIALLSALRTYGQGRGVRGNATWTPVQQVNDALDKAFYLAFQAVEPTNLRWLLALDVSGSMCSGEIAGVAGLSPRDASAAMALVTAAVESNHYIVGFSNGPGPSMHSSYGYGSGLTEIPISPRIRLDTAIKKISAVPMGGTDCSLPMKYATENKIPVDVFVEYTDNETWHSKPHPCQALQEYRQKMGIPAKLIVCGMVSNGFTIADPDDAGMLDVVGFSTDTPQVMSEFALGKI